MFDDDWNAAEYLYPRPSKQNLTRQARPPVTLLVVSAGNNVIFDPTREEIAVADAVLAVSIARDDGKDGDDGHLKLLSIRTIDPPSRLTNHGIPNSENAATLAVVAGEEPPPQTAPVEENVPGVWKPSSGGVSRRVISKMVKMVLEKGGVGDEVMEGLAGVDVS